MRYGQLQKWSLVYDLQEPYRWLVDSQNGRLRSSLKPEALRKLMDALRTKFNPTARYEGKFNRWDTILGLKAQELANYFLRKRIELSCEDLKPALSRDDHAVVRDKILSLTIAEAGKHGIGKTTLWYVQRRVFGEKPFKIYRNTRIRLAQ